MGHLYLVCVCSDGNKITVGFQPVFGPEAQRALPWPVRGAERLAHRSHAPQALIQGELCIEPPKKSPGDAARRRASRSQMKRAREALMPYLSAIAT